MDLSKPLAILALVVGAGSYLGAVSGALFDEATPPTDVGALTTLAIGVLFGVLGFLLGRQPQAAPAPSRYR
jgi:hypothetical protein